MTKSYFVMPVLFVLASCSSETPAPIDMGPGTDSGVHDFGTDLGASDGALGDLGDRDSAILDGALSDAEAIDLGPADLGTSDLGTDSGESDSGASDGGPSPLHALCTATDGTVATHSCCGATSDFPDTCGIGACSCAPSSSHDVSYCECPEGECFSPTTGCTSIGL